ncbi:MAG: Asp-tRNA(Asn)/Glu-tRNA(Gln) amidotransferase subunit GatC [Candidatus Gracilibacteria bacterium]|nr:Asp-tRNA(Asn)/Glu-tRNA(Gln) amidotransferase subunit GatC [Candidatus Gracilibacteria bacterium]
MSITQDQIKHLAKLSKLEFSEEELEKFAKDFNSIIDYVGKLNEIDNSMLEKVRSIDVENPLILRKDETVEKKEFTKKDLLSCTQKPVINDQIALGNIMN